MNGYTKGARNELFALRPAPIQVMWLGYPGTSGAPFMDYIITDKTTSPLHLTEQYSEKLAYMPNTFFIGDHAHMFPHINTKVVLDIPDSSVTHQDNVCLINGSLSKELLEGHSNGVINMTPQDSESSVVFPVLDQAVSSHINNLVQSSQTNVTINGFVIQNGLTTNQVSTQQIDQMFIYSDSQSCGMFFL